MPKINLIPLLSAGYTVDASIVPAARFGGVGSTILPLIIDEINRQNITSIQTIWLQVINDGYWFPSILINQEYIRDFVRTAQVTFIIHHK